jgi:hypothetical protein
MANKQPKNNNRTDRGANRKAGNAPELSPEEQRRILARSLGIKPKTREFVDLLNADPKLSAAEAYIRTHETNSRITAKNAASKLLQKPAVIGYKDAAVKKAKRRIVSLVDSDNENISLKASQDILDRNEGKAVTKQEITSKTVTVKLDLSGLRVGAHFIPPAQIVPPTE